MSFLNALTTYLKIAKAPSSTLPLSLAQSLVQTHCPELLGTTPDTHAQIHQWITTPYPHSFTELDSHLSTRTFMVNSTLTLADIYVWAGLYDRKGQVGGGKYASLLRYYDLMQHLVLGDAGKDGFGFVNIDLNVPMPVAKKVAAQPDLNEKKADKKTAVDGKSKPAVEVKAAPTPSRLDLRVGKILEVKQHPDADSLYVSQIACGDDKPRQIVSGLVKHMSLSDLQDRLVIVICNLKPAKMRGIESAGMVFCAEKDGKVETLIPHASSAAGDRVFFEGCEEGSADIVLKAKEKVWETLQPAFKVDESLRATWVRGDGSLCVMKTAKGDVLVKSLEMVGGAMK